METKKAFDKRAFTAVGSCVSGLCLPVTGYANHVYQMEPMTMARHAWMSAHNIFALMFVFFVGWHIILNRRALLKHLRGAASSWRRLVSREAVYAVSAVAFVAFFFISHAFHAR